MVIYYNLWNGLDPSIPTDVTYIKVFNNIVNIQAAYYGAVCLLYEALVVYLKFQVVAFFVCLLNGTTIDYHGMILTKVLLFIIPVKAVTLKKSNPPIRKDKLSNAVTTAVVTLVIVYLLIDYAIYLLMFFVYLFKYLLLCTLVDIFNIDLGSPAYYLYSKVIIEGKYDFFDCLEYVSLLTC